MLFEYRGDSGSPIISWFKKHLTAVECCYNNGLPEATLVLLYSGIDTLGWFTAPPDVSAATRKTFIDWCEKYLVARLCTPEGERISAVDLYAARCGVLHTSRASSKLGGEGGAREVFYHYNGQDGVNLGLNVPLVPVRVELKDLVVSFAAAGSECLKQLSNSPPLLEACQSRALTLFRWGKLVF